MSDEGVARATTMIRSARFMTLATTDSERPWASPVAFIIGPTGTLVFYSALNSVHARNALSAPVAASIFDSRATSEEADGLQILGHVREVEEERVADFAALYFRTQFPDPAQRSSFERAPQFFVAPAEQRFYELELLEAYVLDLEGYDVQPHEPLIDMRVAISVPDLIRQLSNDDG